MVAYAALAEVKQLLTDLGDDHNTLIGVLLTRASRLIDDKCHRAVDAFAPTIATKQFDGTGRRTLFVPDLASVAANGLEVKLDGTGGSVWTIVPTADFFLEPTDRDTRPAQWIELSDAPTGDVSVFPAGKRTVRIAGSWGFAAIPEPIKSATLDLVIDYWRTRGAAGVDPVELVGPMSQPIWPRALPSRVWGVIQDYRMARVA